MLDKTCFGVYLTFITSASKQHFGSVKPILTVDVSEDMRYCEISNGLTEIVLTLNINKHLETEVN